MVDNMKIEENDVDVEQIKEYKNNIDEDREIKNPKMVDGNYKNFKLTIAYEYKDEDEDLIYVSGDFIGYFNRIDEIKDFLLRRKSEIEEYYQDCLSKEFIVSSLNKPFPDEVLKKRFKERKDFEDGMLFCPYCGRWRYFFEDESGYEKCTTCGVHKDNYDVQKWILYRG